MAQELCEQRAGVNLIAYGSERVCAGARRAFHPALCWPATRPGRRPAIPIWTWRSAPRSSSINEYFGSFRLDHRINDKFTQYLRYNRDQGYLTQPLDVTGSSQIVTGVPQNVVYTLQPDPQADRRQRNQAGLQRQQDAHQRLHAADPGRGYQRVRGELHGHRGDSGRRRPGRFGGRRVARQSRPRQQLAERPRPALHELHDVLHRQSQRHPKEPRVEVRLRVPSDPPVHGPAGRHHLHLPEYRRAAGEQPTNIQVLGDTSAPDPWNNGATGNRYLKQYYLIFYAQDEWKIRPNLTINYGLRYEYYQPAARGPEPVRPLQRRYRQARLRHDTRLRPAEHHALVQASKMNFGPRLAISWSPTKFNDKTVFRVGAGYYYGPGPDRGPGAADRFRPRQPHADQQHRLADHSGAGAGRLQHQRSEPRLPAARLRLRLHAAGEGALLHRVDPAGTAGQCGADGGLRRQPGPQPLPAIVDERHRRRDHESHDRSRHTRSCSSATGSPRSTTRPAAARTTTTRCRPR